MHIGAKLLVVALSLALLSSACGTEPLHASPMSMLSPSRAIGYLSAVTCPNSSVCYAVGAVAAPPTPPRQGFFYKGAYQSPPGVVLKSENGGQSWLRLSPPSATGPLHGLFCWTALRCIADGQIVYGPGPGGLEPGSLVIGTTNGGVSWRELAKPESVTKLTDLACFRTTCVAAGDTGLAPSPETILISRDAGNTWTPISDRDRALLHLALDPILGNASCLSIDRCVIVNLDSSSLMSTADAGVKWNNQRLPEDIKPTVLVCPTAASRCILAGYDLRAPANGPITGAVAVLAGGSISQWRQVRGGSTAGFCLNAHSCILVGLWGRGNPQLYSARTHDAGNSWQVSYAARRAVPQAIACTVLARCIVVGSIGYGDRAPLLLIARGFGSSWVPASIREPRSSTTVRGEP